MPLECLGYTVRCAAAIETEQAASLCHNLDRPLAVVRVPEVGIEADIITNSWLDHQIIERDGAFHERTVLIHVGG